MKQIIILGHFGFGKNKVNGQTIKTKIVAQATIRHFGEENVQLEDTQGGWKFLVRLPFLILRLLYKGQNIIILPSKKGSLIIPPMLTTLNRLFHRHLYYVSIGRCLVHHTKRFRNLKDCLNRFQQIYVETPKMANSLKELGLKNICQMPNCKPLEILSKDEIQSSFEAPYRLCTFSRIIKEKGIEDAIQAVRICNDNAGKEVFALDIYGQVEDQLWFNNLMIGQPKYIQYRGIIPYHQTTSTLKDYFALLFPTYYNGEAFAGTLIDALAAGLPALASDWHDNSDIVIPGQTGYIFPTHSVEALTAILQDCAAHPENLLQMRQHCIVQAQQYQPDVVLSPLFQRIEAQ